MSQHTAESAGSMVIGFILAIGNHVFGWFNTFLTINLNNTVQALITGFVGALGAFLGNRLLKYIEKKIKQKKQEHKY